MEKISLFFSLKPPDAGRAVIELLTLLDVAQPQTAHKKKI